MIMHAMPCHAAGRGRMPPDLLHAQLRADLGLQQDTSNGDLETSFNILFYSLIEKSKEKVRS